MSDRTGDGAQTLHGRGALSARFDEGSDAPDIPTPLWLAGLGLALGAAFAGFALSAEKPWETTALLVGAAAAGGLGLYGAAERVIRAGAPRGLDPVTAFADAAGAAPDPTFLFDRSGRALWANPAACALAPGAATAEEALAAAMATARRRGGATDPDGSIDGTADAAGEGAHDDHFAGDGRASAFHLLSAALAGRSAERRLGAEPAAPTATAWATGDGRVALRISAAGPEGAGWTERPGARRRDGADPFGSADVAVLKVSPTGRIASANAVFRRWTGLRSGGVRPSFAALFPDADHTLGGPQSTRFIGAAGAPSEVDLLAHVDPSDGGVVVVCAPVRGAASSTPSRGGAEHDGDPSGALDGAPIGVVVVGASGRVLRVNREADAAFAAMEFDADAGSDGAEGPIAGPLGDHFADWVVDDDRLTVERAIAAAADGRSGEDDVVRTRLRAVGDGRDARVDLVCRSAGGGRVAIWLLPAVDERLRIEQNALQGQKLQAIGQLAGGVAHDFNNMLTVIIGASEEQIDRRALQVGDPDYVELDAVRQAGRRAAHLVKQLLAYSRRQTMRPQKTDLTEHLSIFSSLLQRTIAPRAELDPDFEEELWAVRVDRNQIGQVVMNLVVNARDASPDGGVVRLRTRNERVDAARHGPGFTMPPGEYVRIDVADRGVGVPPDVQEKIFEPFFTTKDIGQGTGLGLSTVYGIVKQSNGYIFLRTAVGEGSTFSVYLPRNETPDEDDGAETSKRLRLPTSGVGKRILIAEDEEAVLNLAARALRSQGYEVVEARDGDEALAILEDESVALDLLLSDVQMPAMDGPTVLKNLGGRRPDLRVVFMTGYARDAFAETLDDAFAEGRSYEVLEKPYTLVELQTAVAEAIAATASAEDRGDDDAFRRSGDV